MELVDKMEPAFSVIGAILIMIVVYYVKGIMNDLKSLGAIPDLINRMNIVLKKLEGLLIDIARIEERVKAMESRIEKLENIANDTQKK